MATSKNGPTLAALNAQIAVLQAQADALRKKDVTEVIAKMKDAIVRYGLTAADLGLSKAAGQLGKSSAPVGGKPAKKTRKNAAAKPAGKKVKFTDDQGHTWGGIGKRPVHSHAAAQAMCLIRKETSTNKVIGFTICSGLASHNPKTGGSETPVATGKRAVGALKAKNPAAAGFFDCSGQQ